MRTVLIADFITLIKYILSSMGLFAFAWFLQTQLLLNADVSWLILASQRLLQGGTYLKNFFEINPPLILYLYSPLAFSGIAIPIALKLYVFSIALGSLLLCQKIVTKIMPSPKWTHLAFFITLAIIFTILPLNEFGQREHLFVLLTTPYFLLAAATLQKNSIPWPFKLIIGCIAGIGFTIKPFFIIPFIGLEILLWRKKIKLIRPELIAAISVMLLSILLIILFHREYLTAVIPQVSTFYYQHYTPSFWHLLYNEQAIFIYSVLGFYLIFYKKLSEFYTVIAVACISCLLVYFAQRTFWYYHFLPTFSYAILLLGLLFMHLLLHPKLSRTEIISLSSLALLLSGYFYWREQYFLLGINFYPFAFFGLFGFVFLLSLFFNNSLRIKFIAITVLPILGGILLAIIHVNIWLAITIMLFLFFLLIPHKKTIFFTCMSLLLFSFPFQKMGYTFSIAEAYKHDYDHYLKTITPFANKSIYYFTDSAEFAFPSSIYLHQDYTSRFGCFLWASLVRENHLSTHFFTDAVTEDIVKNKPEYIFVDTRNSSKNLGYFGNNQINYLALFTSNKNFSDEWKHYQLIQTIDGQPLYRFQIYKRHL